jgi:CRP-like cAMP-binding protein
MYDVVARGGREWAQKEDSMTSTVAQMTREELREMIEASIEQKLLEILGDPDEALEIRESVRDRLLRQREAVAAGERGQPFDEVVQQLGLE